METSEMKTICRLADLADGTAAVVAITVAVHCMMDIQSECRMLNPAL